MIYTCIIIDDERHFTTLLEEYIAELPELELIKTFHDPTRAIAELTAEHFIADIIFLDIHMPHISGIELAPHLKKKCKFLVFITAHAQYAVNAFDLEADDFLYKPFKIERLQQSIKKITGHTTPAVQENTDNDFFFIKISGTQSKYLKFLYSEVIAFESDKNYIRIYTPNDCYRIYLGINEVEKKLAGRNDFIKVHRSFIISKAYIELVENNMVVMKNSNVQVVIGKQYKASFFAYLESHKF
ncbi:LytR/AlgR family response regulator transcription factor [Pedobacter heparinus]|uniref:LytTr DNA-binding region n=1 Tax=Pedobacter heparinus (strain ATCC 13125 / DSM 2366 / CIP 104194 / JCM 7457 / NBRC 12017 / NCIMB 9290 / NRRL B-14731 / HIM 762-3) TaxID=485917 RepID=C6Y3I8_PEDHD|nr:LytTR family DNA-binding domain-containing protein [Pedobacter heparinus]ACU03267.1 LytTr DNA-binding region [Pedobacter heparinus DSM 2366]